MPHGCVTNVVFELVRLPPKGGLSLLFCRRVEAKVHAVKIDTIEIDGITHAKC
jgi:hypothetical protein